VVGISLSNPTGFTNCQDKLVASFPSAVTGANFPTMSVDTAGNLFAVWEQAPGTGAGAITGNTQLYFSQSTDQGNTWTAAAQIPTPGLNQDVYAWPAAGDPGRFDVAFYGAPEAWAAGDTGGPDSVKGHYSLYLAQTLDGGANWIVNLASEHFVHYGTMYTLIGSQTGDRTLGDFLQMRLGSQGQALISYADSNNIDETTTPEAMFVQQNAGPSLYANRGTVTGPAAPSGGCVTDPSGDASFDAASVVNTASSNLDLLGACVTQPDATHYQFTMQVADLSSLQPTANDGGTDLVWQMQWHVPSTSDAKGGKLFMVYMESQFGQTPTCWVGQNATNAVGGGVELTYPGDTPLTGTACQYTATAPGTITITVPTSAVSVANPVSGELYSVTASTQTLPFAANFLPDVGGSGVGGYFPNLIDVAPAFDFGGSASSGPQTPEAPWVPLVALAGASAAAFAYRRRRRGADAA
jgi:hypothetical protein